jgi:hypothetical protein
MLLGGAGPQAGNRNENAEAIVAMPDHVSNKSVQPLPGMASGWTIRSEKS